MALTATAKLKLKKMNNYARVVAWRKRNPKKYKAQMARFYQNHKEKVKGWVRRFRKRRKENKNV